MNDTHQSKILFILVVSVLTSFLIAYVVSGLEVLSDYTPFSLEWAGSNYILFVINFFLIFDVLILAVEAVKPSGR